MSHHHHHDHEHGGHGAQRQKNRGRLALTLVLTLTYMLAEVVGGWWSGSLALLADAGHMLSDAAALGLSLFAIWIAGRPPTPHHSYGYYRAEILAALANGVALVVIAIFVFIEAIARFGEPHPVEGGLMMAVAVGGLIVNLAGLAILHSSKGDSLNIHGAWLHLLTDALGSVAALAAGGLIWFFGWDWADPLASILIALLVVYSSWGLLGESISILMQSTPGHIDIDAVRNTLAGGPGVCEVHDLHLWTITSGMQSLSAHVVLTDGHAAPATLSALRRSLHEQFGIDHVTIQVDAHGQQDCPSPF